MAPTEMNKFGFAKLGDDNYGTWKVQMRGLLATKDCNEALDNAEDPHSNKAKGLMIMCVEEQHLQTIGDAANAMEAWQALEALYQQTSTANLLQLKKQLAGLQKRSTETITQYMARARAIGGQVQAATGQAVDATDMTLAVLSGLPSEYNVIKTVIENTQDAADLDVDDILPRLVATESTAAPDARPSRSTDAAFLAKPAPHRHSKPPPRRDANPGRCGGERLKSTGGASQNIRGTFGDIRGTFGWEEFTQE